MEDSTPRLALALLAKRHVERICPAGDQAAAARMIDNFAAAKGKQLASDKDMAVGLQLFLWDYVLKHIECRPSQPAATAQDGLQDRLARLLDLLEEKERHEAAPQVSDATLNAAGLLDRDAAAFMDTLLGDLAHEGTPAHVAVQAFLQTAGGDPDVGLTEQEVGDLAARYAALESEVLDAASDLGVRVEVPRMPLLKIGDTLAAKKQALTIIWAMQRLLQRLKDRLRRGPSDGGGGGGGGGGDGGGGGGGGGGEGGTPPSPSPQTNPAVAAALQDKRDRGEDLANVLQLQGGLLQDAQERDGLDPEIEAVHARLQEAMDILRRREAEVKSLEQHVELLQGRVAQDKGQGPQESGVGVSSDLPGLRSATPGTTIDVSALETGEVSSTY